MSRTLKDVIAENEDTHQTADGSFVHAPANTLLRIDKVFMFVSVDKDGNEGVCAAPLWPGGDPIPMIAADEARLKNLIPLAEQLSKLTGMTIRLIRLHTREELRTFTPTQHEMN